MTTNQLVDVTKSLWMRNLKLGQRVRAVQRIAFPDFGKELHVHAEEGDEGFVEGIDDCECFIGPGITIRFDKSGTATIVGGEEIEPLEAIQELAKCAVTGEMVPKSKAVSLLVDGGQAFVSDEVVKRLIRESKAKG